MINRYLLTDEVIKSYTKYNCKKFLLCNIIIDALFLVWSIYKYLQYKNNMFLYLIIFILFMMILTFFRVNKTVKVEIERIRIRYGNEPQYMNIEFKDEIIISVNDNSITIPYDKILNYSQTKEFIMVKIKAKMVVVLKNDSFVNGSVEECVNFLDSLKH